MGVRVAFPVGRTAGMPGRHNGMFPTILRSELNDKLIAQGLTDTDERLRAIDSGWPVAVNLETYMQMSWRVREWRIEAGSFIYTGSKSSAGTPPPGSPTWTLTSTFDPFSVKPKRVKNPPDLDNPLRDVADERDLLGPYTDSNNMPEWKTLRNAGTLGSVDPNTINVTRSDSDTGPDAGPFVQPEGFFNTTIFGSYTIFDPDTGLFYPRLALDNTFQAFFDFGAFGTSGVFAGFYLLSTNPIAPPLPAPSFGIAGDVPQGTLTITGLAEGEPDLVIPVGMNGRPGGSAPPFFAHGGSGSVALTMSAIRWWPYATKAGAPVYDESTGAQLADPFS